MQTAIAEYGNLFGQSTYSHYFYNDWYTRVDPIGLPVLRGGNVTISADFVGTLSSTNVQVEGVDEADLVENDGNFLYIVSGQDLVIVDAGAGDDLRIMSRVHLDERPTGIYLSGNRLAIVSSSEDSNWVDGVRAFPFVPVLIAFDDIAIADGHQAGMPQGPTTTVTVLDIIDRAAPTLVQKTQLDGRLVSSRTVDGELRLVLSNELRLPRPLAKLVAAQPGDNPELVPLPLQDGINSIDYKTSDLWRPSWYGDSYVYETLDEYINRVCNDLLDTLDARIRSLSADGNVISDSPLFDATDIYRPDDFFARNVTTIAAFDLNSNQAGPADKLSVLTSGTAQVYATRDNIYVFGRSSPAHSVNGLQIWGGEQKTTVWKFSIGGESHSIELAAKGEFDGTLLNQFAADEHDGYLRVVSKTDAWNGAGQSVLVLQQVGKHLDVVGSVTGIAVNETLHSVRFVGDRLFFVTFRRIDPLFAVDLSDPTHPEMMGELHIPGYSEYLQPIDDTHLLAIGRDTTLWNGGVVEPDALQLSIFDVSDLSNPRLTDRYSFGGGFSTITPATGSGFLPSGDGDHHAVSYFADAQILALPIHTLETYSSWWWGNTEPLFEPGQGGLQVFRVDVDAGFTPITLIEHDTLIERSVQIGDRLFAISSGTLSVHDLADPNVQLGEIDLGAIEEMPSVEPKMYQPPIIESIQQLTVEANVEPAPAASSLTGWVLPSLNNFRHTQPACGAAFNSFTASRHVDDDSLQLLAADFASDSPVSESADQGNPLREDLEGNQCRDRAAARHQHVAVPRPHSHQKRDFLDFASSFGQD